RNKAVLSGGLHPHYRETVETLAHAVGIETEACSLAVDNEAEVLNHIDADTACVVVQTPNVFGTATDLTKIAEAAQAAGALLIVVVTEVMSLGLLKSPGEMGADVVAVEGQSIGVPLSYGGPYVGLFAAKEKYLRQMPGRLCGETVDADGERGFVLTLSTREQHIRRDKATSNICTNSGLCALAFSVEVVTPRFFNEFTVAVSRPAAEVVEALAARDILGGVPVSRLDADPAFANHLIIATTETVSDADIDALVGALEEVL
ncbi:MAG: PLP-dependent transferase, partial [Asticcacaulis sp.]|nr:PLP-dependent transferase [Asticcacaulis sp.]